MTDDNNHGDAESLIFGGGSDWFDDDENEIDPSMDLPHWTEPGATGPSAVDGGVDPSIAAVAGPRWRGSGADFDEVDDVRIFADTADPVPPPAMLSDDDDESFPSFTDPIPASASVGGPPNVVRITDDSLRNAGPANAGAPGAPGYATPSMVADPNAAGPIAAPPPPGPAEIGGYAPSPYAAAPPGPGLAPGPVGPGGPGQGFGAPAMAGSSDSPRDLASAVGVGVLLAAVAAGALYLSPLYATVLVALVLFLSVAEFYNAARQVGYDPATFAGVAFTGFLPLAIYWRGLLAYPVIMFVAILAALLWYLFGASAARPIANIAMTLLGMVYVGILGSFAALMLISYSEVDGAIEQHGTGLFLAAILCTVAYDVGAYFAGRAFGRTPLSTVSPNKTLEGLMGGVAASLGMSVLIIGMLDIAPWGANPGGLVASIILGFVAAISATLGDLCESMMKRDMGIKDMGSILPGHGGLLDRFDSLLFVVPTTWATALVLGVIEAPL